MYTPPQLLRQAWDAAAIWHEQHQVCAGAVGQDPHNERLERSAAEQLVRHQCWDCQGCHRKSVSGRQQCRKAQLSA